MGIRCKGGTVLRLCAKAGTHGVDMTPLKGAAHHMEKTRSRAAVWLFSVVQRKTRSPGGHGHGISLGEIPRICKPEEGHLWRQGAGG